jgi:hypothetical protein
VSQWPPLKKQKGCPFEAASSFTLCAFDFILRS